MNDSRMEFGFNEERILKDGEYTVEEIWEMLDEIMNERHLYSTRQGLYEGIYKEHACDYVSAMVHLTGITWFRKYCNKWIYVDPEDGVADAYLSMKECHLLL
jgi:hypothetical protein